MNNSVNITNDDLTLVRLLNPTTDSKPESVVVDDLTMARITNSRRSNEIPDEVINEFKRTANSKSSKSLTKCIIENAVYAVVAIGATAGFFVLGALMTLCFG